MSVERATSNFSKRAVKDLSKQASEASALMKALSHETRLLILCLLSEGELSVSQIEELIDLPQATVSQQLARLRFSALVTTRRDGRTIYYALADGEAKVIVKTLHKLYCNN